MYVVVMVVSSRDAHFIAQGILDGVIGSGYVVNDSFVQKSLKRSVDGYPIKLLIAFVFYVLVGQSIVGREKNIQDFFSALRYTECAAFEYRIRFFVHLIPL